MPEQRALLKQSDIFQAGKCPSEVISHLMCLIVFIVQFNIELQNFLAVYDKVTCDKMTYDIVNYDKLTYDIVTYDIVNYGKNELKPV